MKNGIEICFIVAFFLTKKHLLDPTCFEVSMPVSFFCCFWGFFLQFQLLAVWSRKMKMLHRCSSYASNFLPNTWWFCRYLHAYVLKKLEALATVPFSMVYMPSRTDIKTQKFLPLHLHPGSDRTHNYLHVSESIQLCCSNS